MRLVYLSPLSMNTLAARVKTKFYVAVPNQCESLVPCRPWYRLEPRHKRVSTLAASVFIDKGKAQDAFTEGVFFMKNEIANLKTLLSDCIHAQR